MASAECVFYIIESPDLYDYNDSVWLYQFRETLQEASKSRDVKRMVEAEESIRQLLEIDFQSKFKQTIEVNFGSKIIKMLNKYLLSMAEEKRQVIWQQSERARANKRQAIEKEAQAKIDERNRKLREIEGKIVDYNQAVAGINSCLEAMKLGDYKLPTLPENNSIVTPIAIDTNPVESDDSPPELTPRLDSEDDASATQSYINTNPVESDDSPPEPALSPDPLARPEYPSHQTASSNQLERGKLVHGTITNITEHVVYVDVDGINGSLYIKNVSEGYIGSLSELFEEGEEIKALIVELDDGKGRISLSTKVLENSKGEILKKKNEVMAAAEARAARARRKLPKS